MNFEVRSNFLYFLSKLRICTYVLCYWPKHFISCDKTTNLSHDVWKAWNILRRTGLDISAHPLTQVSVKSVGRVQITDHIEVKNRSVYHVRDNVASELFMINTCSPGKLKIEVIPFGFRKSLKRKRKKKTRKLLVIQRAQRSTRRTDRGSFQRNGKLAGHGCSMIRIRVWYASGA